MAIATIIAPMKGGTLFAAADRSFTGTNAYESLLLPSGRAGFFVADGPCARRVRGKRPRTAEAADRGIRRPCGVGERQAIKPTVKLYLSVANGRLFFLSRSCRGGTGFSGRLMPAGHLLFCATKKGDKKVAGNAIPRSRLPSERKIAHSRAGSLCLKPVRAKPEGR